MVALRESDAKNSLACGAELPEEAAVIGAHEFLG
jgi:hypothetical protein